MNGAFLVVDKPEGITSHDVVAAVRAVTGIKKVGHTGTLDPFATGVLPLALGTSTRLIQFLDEGRKVYDATIRLGAATDTGDPTGQVVREAPLPTATEAEVVAVLAGMVGPVMQTPPAYSAVKVKGKPLYKYAREGVEVEVAARQVHYYGVDLLAWSADTLRVRLTCSRGTYARVFADDLATLLGSAGHLSALSRTGSGPFMLDGALSMPDLGVLASADPDATWQATLLGGGKNAPKVPWRSRDEVLAGVTPLMRSTRACLSHLPQVEIDEASADRVRAGAWLPAPPDGLAMGGRYIACLGDDVQAVIEHAPHGPKSLCVVDPICGSGGGGGGGRGRGGRRRGR